MKSGGYAVAFLILAVLASWEPAAGSALDRPRRAADTKPPASSLCMARCDEMERRCEALEKEFPACGTVEICYVEKQQCVALCRVAARPAPRVCS